MSFQSDFADTTELCLSWIIKLFLGGVPGGFHTSKCDFVCVSVCLLQKFVTGICYMNLLQGSLLQNICPVTGFCYRIYAPDKCKIPYIRTSKQNLKQYNSSDTFRRPYNYVSLKTLQNFYDENEFQRA